MSVSIDSSSSLNVLERYNVSKTTVSSSDTDTSSAGYASSSGTTTPEDDAQMFHLGHTFQDVMTDTPKKPTIVPKKHGLSLAVKRVKKVAHALAAFKRKRPDDISPILISSPLRERFGKRMAVKPQPDEAFYTLPNRRFSLSDVSEPSDEMHPRTITRKYGTISGSTFVNGMPRRQRSGPRIPSFSQSMSTALQPSTSTAMQQTENDVLTYRTIFFGLVRILLFVPWCVAVGGALLLFPSHVELVAFGPGYLSSPKGIRRFAHWADCGQQHVMIFLSVLIALAWYNRALGISVTTIVVSRFVFVWHAFKVDRSIPLGEDDQQSLYLVATGMVSKDSSFRVSGPRDVQIVEKIDSGSG